MSANDAGEEDRQEGQPSMAARGVAFIMTRLLSAIAETKVERAGFQVTFCVIVTHPTAQSLTIQR